VQLDQVGVLEYVTVGYEFSAVAFEDEGGVGFHW
jgi:hypothetical protein